MSEQNQQSYECTMSVAKEQHFKKNAKCASSLGLSAKKASKIPNACRQLRMNSKFFEHSSRFTEVTLFCLVRFAVLKICWFPSTLLLYFSRLTAIEWSKRLIGKKLVVLSAELSVKYRTLFEIYLRSLAEAFHFGFGLYSRKLFARWIANFEFKWK